MVYYAQSNGCCEKMNQTLLQMLRCFSQGQINNLDKYLPFVKFAYNVSPNATMEETPYAMLHGDMHVTCNVN